MDDLLGRVQRFLVFLYNDYRFRDEDQFRFVQDEAQALDGEIDMIEKGEEE